MTNRLEELLGSGRSALLIIDIQNDYIHPDGAVAQSGLDTGPVVAMIPRLHKLIDAAREAAVPLYFLRNWHGPDTDSGPWKTRRAIKAMSEPGRAGSWGADWYEIEPTSDDAVIHKYRYDGFLGTPLELMLRARGIESVICCGTATNVCVESTARAAHMRDFNLVLVADCCAAVDRSLHEATLENIRRHFGTVASAEAVEAAWSLRRSRPEATASE